MATSSSTETFTTLSNHTAIINQSKAKNMKTALGHVNRMLQMYPYVISEENSEQKDEGKDGNRDRLKLER